MVTKLEGEELLDNEFIEREKHDLEDNGELNFHFKLTFDEVNERNTLKSYLKPQRQEALNGVIAFLFLGTIIFFGGYVQGGEAVSAYVLCGVGGTLITLAIYTFWYGIRKRKANEVLQKRMIEVYRSSPEYEIYINEDCFGVKNVTGQNTFAWIADTNIEIRDGHLYIRQWCNQQEPVFILSEADVGKEKYEKVVDAVQNKMKRLRN